MYRIGQLVWVRFHRYSVFRDVPDGEYPGVVVGYSSKAANMYLVDVEGVPLTRLARLGKDHENHWRCFQEALRPRDPPQEREELGSWDLCHWRPPIKERI